MPKDSILWAPARLIASASILAVGLCAASALAQGTARPSVNDRQVEAFFNGIALDQQLAEQYSSRAAPAPLVVAPQQATAQPQSTAVAEASNEERTTIAEDPPSLAQTVMLVLASLALLAFAATVLTLALRELGKEKKQLKRTYRRRVKRRDTSTAAHSS
jgi:hypothetical protein